MKRNWLGCPNFLWMNSAFTTLLERCGMEMVYALLSRSSSDSESTLQIIPTYLTGLFYNLSNFGYRLVQKVALACPPLLEHENLVQEIAVLNEMTQALKEFCADYNTGNDIGWYSFLREGRISYTEFTRKIPILMAFVGRLTSACGAKADKGRKGFGAIDNDGP